MTILQFKQYQVFIGSCAGGLSDLAARSGYSKVAVLVDKNTRQHCLPLVEKELGPQVAIIAIPAGERHKTLETCRLVWGKMMRHGLDRRSLLVNLGGGVIGDLGGFCAATYLRGIAFAQVPTTLLAQVDASVGGKLGVDFNFVKNAIGAFANPRAVFVDPVFLKTLPVSELRSGFAEIFKHALIADAGFWADLQAVRYFEKTDWTPLLARSLRIKQQVVEADPRERDARKGLNFGHTVGHAVESLALRQKRALLHGEAVAIGMVCEAFLSNKKMGLPTTELAEITAFSKRLYPRFVFGENDFAELLQFMSHDKKNLDGQINFSLLPAIGQVRVNQVCGEGEIADGLRYYCRQFPPPR